MNRQPCCWLINVNGAFRLAYTAAPEFRNTTDVEAALTTELTTSTPWGIFTDTSVLI